MGPHNSELLLSSLLIIYLEAHRPWLTKVLNITFVQKRSCHILKLDFPSMCHYEKPNSHVPPVPQLW